MGKENLKNNPDDELNSQDKTLENPLNNSSGNCTRNGISYAEGNHKFECGHVLPDGSTSGYIIMNCKDGGWSEVQPCTG
jgi:hypothetical protein